MCIKYENQLATKRCSAMRNTVLAVASLALAACQDTPPKTGIVVGTPHLTGASGGTCILRYRAPGADQDTRSYPIVTRSSMFRKTGDHWRNCKALKAGQEFALDDVR